MADAQIELRDAPKDERLEMVLGMVSDAVGRFVEALAKIEDEVAYKAFIIPDRENMKEVEMLCDVILTAIGLELKKQAPDYMGTHTFSACMDNRVEDKETIVWMKCKVGAPPAPAETTAELPAIKEAEAEAEAETDFKALAELSARH